jgi:hypothetical protein
MDASSNGHMAEDAIADALRRHGCVYRFCHHQSIGGDQDFWNQPIGNVSPDGRWAIFTSNWGQTLLNKRQDVFLLNMR